MLVLANGLIGGVLAGQDVPIAAYWDDATGARVAEVFAAIGSGRFLMVPFFDSLDKEKWSCLAGIPELLPRLLPMPRIGDHESRLD